MSDLRHPTDSAHPDELLAGLVDGTLSAAERADLQAHLDGCEQCRSQVAPAEAAARALRELPELDAPWGLGRKAIEESRKGAGRIGSRRFGAAAGVAAATILLVGLAFAVLRGPQDSEKASSPLVAGTTQSQPEIAPVGGASDSGVAKNATVPVIKQSRNYEAADVQHLASSFALEAKSLVPSVTPQPQPSAPPATSAATSGPGSQSFSPTVRSAGAPDRSAAGVVSCIDAAAGLDSSARPVRVIEARFQEKPALIGIFLNGPGAGQPADLVVVWVSSQDCEFLHYASHRIEP